MGIGEVLLRWVLVIATLGDTDAIDKIYKSKEYESFVDTPLNDDEELSLSFPWGDEWNFFSFDKRTTLLRFIKHMLKGEAPSMKSGRVAVDVEIEFERPKLDEVIQRFGELVGIHN